MELSLLQQRLGSAEAEVEGLKTAASQAAARHAEQLARCGHAVDVPVLWLFLLYAYQVVGCVICGVVPGLL
jgi:hypothetical protein